VQNAVDRSVMGVATSGSTMFRQIGGSIGVALFGTIFASRVHVELANRLPSGTRVPKTINPEGIKHLPPTVHAAYQDAFAVALHPVFLTAAIVSLLAFVLTWFLREVPLRVGAQPGQVLTPPGDPESVAA